MNARAKIASITQQLKEVTEIRDKIKKLDEEYELGRLEETKYKSLKQKYEQELTKYESVR